MTTPERYGNRNVPKMIREWDAHRQVCRAEGTPAIQATLDAVEEHIDYAYRADLSAPAPDAMEALVNAAAAVSDALDSENAAVSYEMARDLRASLAAYRGQTGKEVMPNVAEGSEAGHGVVYDATGPGVTAGADAPLAAAHDDLATRLSQRGKLMRESTDQYIRRLEDERAEAAKALRGARHG